MARWISFFALFAFLILCIFSSYVYTYRAEFLSTELSRAIGVPVKIKSIELAGSVKMRGVRLYNPPDCSEKCALSINKLFIKLSLKDLFKIITGVSSSNIAIKEIKIEKPEVNFELFSATGLDNNWKSILAKVEAAKKETSSRKFEVKKVIVTNIQLEAAYHSHPKTTLKPAPIAKIELKNIGGSEPIDIRAVMQEVLKTLTERSSKQLGLDKLQSLTSPQEINETSALLQGFMKKKNK